LPKYAEQGRPVCSVLQEFENQRHQRLNDMPKLSKQAVIQVDSRGDFYGKVAVLHLFCKLIHVVSDLLTA
jgi:hypothetical protein